ncbi:Ribosomal L1 domain-containing protein 1 [Aphanomyces cochlioides]|nr:Ribosomal L1 domain-containing protein 1 [Aphanomyces cochlioides]
MEPQLDAEQVRKAVVALKQFIQKKKSQNSKQALVEDNQVIQIIFTRNTVPAKESLKPVPIALPNNIRGDGEVCLFVKDSDKDRIKAHLKNDPIPGLTKVMPVKKLKKNFSQFKDKRELKAAYDLFLADDRILPYLKSLLGKTFFDAKKQPTTVNVTGKKNISDHIRRVLAGTEMFISPGPCFNVKIAHDGMDNEKIIENIIEGTKNIVEHVPKKWKNIKSINIKTSDSVALPIYNSLPNSSKLPTDTKKRKVEEASPAEEQPAKKAKTEEKKAKVVAKPATTKAAEKADKVEKKVAPAKKEGADAKKPVAPKKEQNAAKKGTPAAKESTTVKKEKSTPAEAAPAVKKEKTTPTKESKKAASPATKESTPSKKEVTKKAASPATKESTPSKSEKSPAKKAASPKDKAAVKKEKTTPTKKETPTKSPAKKGKKST